ncbi:MAG: cytidylate kinase family protein [Spirochaetales bacterium]|nr:cytidylate kinase family protein [Spirochaetales bacterium]
MKKKIKIAISGKSGCGNSTVSRLTAEKLGLRMINYTFHSIAEEKGMDFRELCRLAEEDSSWDLYLDKKQIELASRGDCVLGSRLAVWLLKDADLKVFLDAAQEIRAERIRTREGGRYEDVYRETLERDNRDHTRYLKLYNIDNSMYDFVDLVINTSEFTAEEIATRIVAKAALIKK